MRGGVHHWRAVAALLALLAPAAVWGQAGSVGSEENSGGQDLRTATATNDSAALQTTRTTPSSETMLSQTSSPPQSLPYGSGERAYASIADLGPSHNFLLAGSDFTARYDDNVRQSNSNRIPDTGYLISPLVAVRHEGGRFDVALRYQPTLLLYRHQTQYNEQDHDLDFDGDYQATERFSLRARTSFLYRNGLLQSFDGTTIVTPLGPPGHLNDTIVAPIAGTWESNSRVDADCRLGPRATLGIFTTYARRTFGRPLNSRAALLVTEGKTAGAEYVYSASQRVTLSAVYAFENLHVGPYMKLRLHAPTFGLAMRMSPHVQMNLFAGPVYTQLHDAVLVPVTPLVTLVLPVARGEWHWSAGGGITVSRERTVLTLNGSRLVTDGGGLLDAVTSAAASLELERRLARRWRVQWTAGWQQNQTLPTAALAGQIDGEYGRILFLHSLSDRITAGIGYQYQRQKGTGVAPLGSSFDRNFVYCTLNYRFRTIPLGR